MLLTLGVIWALAALMMSVGWVFGQRRSNVGHVDVLWSFGLAASAIGTAAMGAGAPAPRLMLALAGGFWGLRLGAHLWHRVAHEPEDGRYAYLRTLWGNHGGRWFAMFQFQALLIVMFSVPFVVVATNPTTQLRWLILAALIWLGSVAGEGIADQQLARFKADPANRGRTCRQGMWAWSRHPNYFFEALQWLTYPVLAIGAPVAPLAWSGPIVMLLFLRYLSGIPFTEQQALRTRGEDYRDYQRTTSMLIPWPPRKPGSHSPTRSLIS
jgi:steroid 5-alpha reductase family enzyme